MYPRLNIRLSKFSHNGSELVKLCEQSKISAAAVTKVFCADRKMVEALSKIPFAFLADSRLENIESYPENLSQQKMLLRLPMPSEAHRVVKSADISLNSEIHTIKRLAEAAFELNKTHGIILMIDLGDLREGVYHSNASLIRETVSAVLSEKNL